MRKVQVAASATAQTSGTVVFLGGGNITSALAAGLRLAGDNVPLVVYDRNPAKLEKLRRESRVQPARDLQSAIAGAQMLLVAVRPAVVSELLDEVEASGARVPKLCISLAAGIPLRTLRGRLGADTRWVRAMPSPVCRAGRGLTALCFDRRLPNRERDGVREFFARVGSVLEIPERQFDAFTAAYSSSHGYHALAALANAAQAAGLDRRIALLAAAHALSDGVLYWRDCGTSLSHLLQEAATPGGIAAATISAMDEAGYARAVTRGIRAGIRQARRNAR